MNGRGERDPLEMMVNAQVNGGERRYQKWLILLTNMNLDLVNGKGIGTPCSPTPPLGG